MISPEKNNVDISKLWNWNEKTIIFGVDGIEEIEVYIRLVGDADWNIARVKSLRASAELRKKLNDPESDEHYAYIPIKESVNKDGLVHMLLALEIHELRDQIIKDMTMPFPTEPKADAGLEALEKYQEEVDKFEDTRQAEIKKRLEKALEKKKAQYEKIPFDRLFDDYIINLTNQLCREELNRTFLEYSTYFGTYKDAEFKERYFESFEQFDNVPTMIKEQLMNRYADLDVQMYELKK